MENEDNDDISRLQENWKKLTVRLKAEFKATLTLEGILFLIGVRELGAHPKKEFTKEEKQDLMHIALCAVLAPSGFFKLSHQDADGWPHWEAQKELPAYDLFSQEIFLKSHIVDYFEAVWT